MHHVYLGVGGNIGNKQQNLEKVRLFIQKEIGEVMKRSSVYETPPWGFLADEDFWNQVLLVETSLEPEEVLQAIQRIEGWFGRKHDAEYYTSREMDVDLLYYDDRIIASDLLIVPHPKIAQRLFVVVPLVEIAPLFQHPVLKMTSRQLFENCPDDSAIRRIEL
ncbi:MAG TPA: 2-amino-4-hydroxy-6-hydroxymethyldihydropteridine diphosphokinase [Mariniphaga sp.]|nr:2-amino-4-hydroxy-6-hydroxymethyldihydropteridine diphosphokinase [Mariniphaga sp.]